MTELNSAQSRELLAIYWLEAQRCPELIDFGNHWVQRDLIKKGLIKHVVITQQDRAVESVRITAEGKHAVQAFGETRDC